MSDQQIPGLSVVPAPDSPDEIETLVGCPWCDGVGMVTSEKRHGWLEAHPELRKLPTDEPPPEAA